MGCYTESLMKEIETLSPADDDYEKRLIEVASLFRAFDLHTVNEVVYYFCMKNGLLYDEAKEILSQIPELKKVKTLPEQDILYTGTIENDIDSIKDKEKLIQYIKDNMDNFTYNNATAIQFIKMFWDKIAGEDGLASKEGELIDKTNPFFFESKDTKDSKNNSKEDAEEKRDKKRNGKSGRKKNMQ